MKTYPSIPVFKLGSSSTDLYTFIKRDGSNLRFEWTKKAGWNKFGTRRRLFDETDEIFGGAIQLFLDSMADRLKKQIIGNKWTKITIFCEFWGNKSFAGLHEKADKKYLTLIDVLVNKKGILPPKEFVREFGHILDKDFIGIRRWNSDFVKEVRNWVPENNSLQCEGVVGKIAAKGKKIARYKLKSQWWYDTVKDKFNLEEAKKLVSS